jgi:hypothetical protein
MLETIPMYSYSSARSDVSRSWFMCGLRSNNYRIARRANMFRVCLLWTNNDNVKTRKMRISYKTIYNGRERVMEDRVVNSLRITIVEERSRCA